MSRRSQTKQLYYSRTLLTCKQGFIKLFRVLLKSYKAFLKFYFLHCCSIKSLYFYSLQFIIYNGPLKLIAAIVPTKYNSLTSDSTGHLVILFPIYSVFLIESSWLIRLNSPISFKSNNFIKLLYLIGKYFINV